MHVVAVTDRLSREHVAAVLQNTQMYQPAGAPSIAGSMRSTSSAVRFKNACSGHMYILRRHRDLLDSAMLHPRCTPP